MGATPLERPLLAALTPPPLPDHVAERTRDRYVEAYERLTSRTFSGSGH